MKINQHLKKLLSVFPSLRVIRASIALGAILIVSGATLISAPRAEASTYTQVDSGTSAAYSGGSYNIFLEYMGDNLTGVPNQLEVYLRSNYASSTASPIIYACDISRATSSPPTTFSNGCPFIRATETQTITNTKSLYLFNFASTTFNLTGKRIYLKDGGSAGNSVTTYSYGSSDLFSYTDGTCSTIQNGGNSVNTWGSCGSVKDLYFRLSTDSVLAPGQDVTQIIFFSPADAVTTGTNVTFNFQSYIAPGDISFLQGYRMNFYVQPQPVGVAIPLLDNISATSTGYFNFSTTTVLTPGTYILNACLQKYYVGNIIGGFDLFGNSCQYHQFVVGTSTFVGNLFQNGISSVQTQLSNISATSSIAALTAYCNLFSGFDIVQCVYALLIPTSSQLKDTMNTFYSDFLARAPWGYGTVAVARILGYGTTATTSLALSNLTIVLPNTGIFATATSTSVLKGKSMTFIDWNMIASSSVRNYWAPALTPLNNFLNIMMGGSFIFWLYHFFKKMRP